MCEIKRRQPVFRSLIWSKHSEPIAEAHRHEHIVLHSAVKLREIQGKPEKQFFKKYLFVLLGEAPSPVTMLLRRGAITYFENSEKSLPNRLVRRQLHDWATEHTGDAFQADRHDPEAIPFRANHEYYLTSERREARRRTRSAPPWPTCNNNVGIGIAEYAAKMRLMIELEIRVIISDECVR